MSRAFSITARNLKKLTWHFNGTTEPVGWAITNVEAGIDKVPGLSKVETGIINGNPHPTPKNNDPDHVSGVIGVKDAKGKNRITSFHAYKDGLIRFSKSVYGEVRV
ncbi:hypothetical protein MaudMau93_004922 [Microsporum audouinii]